MYDDGGKPGGLLISRIWNQPDLDQLSNYRPIANLSLISKITERIVKSRLTDHLTSNKLLNPHQSAYRTVNIIPLKQPFYTFTIISSMH